MLPTLPEAFKTLRAPGLFPVSAVAGFAGCRLKLVSSTFEWRNTHLMSGPDAAIGATIHRIYELWAANLGGTDAGKLFDDEMLATRERLRSDAKTERYADLAATRSFIDWRNLRAAVKARCRTLTRKSRLIPSSSEERQAASASPLLVRQGSEIRLSNRSLRLVGRSDRIERTGDREYRIREFKTGRTVDAEDNVIASIALQLSLYALLVESLDDGCRVTLTVDTFNEQRDVPWDDITRGEARDHLDRALNGLHVETDVLAANIAQVGNECMHCPVRHRCARYLETAPSWWREYPEGIKNAPADTWGIVDAVDLREHKASLRLIDAAGRSVHVDHLRPRPGMEALRGEKVFLFNLEKTGTGRGWNGKPFQPHTFHELASDPLRRRAWATEIFTL